MIRSLILGVLAMVLLVSGPTPAYSCGAKVEIRFFDSDGDIFAIHNKSEGPLKLVSLVIRLTGSMGRLIFDTEYGGPGASMATPFVAVSDLAGGAVGFQGATPVDDGGEVVVLKFSDFQPGREFMFVIDVDDRLENSEFDQAEVSNAEIEGAAAKAVLMGKSGQSSTAKGLFDGDARALLKGGVRA